MRSQVDHRRHPARLYVLSTLGSNELLGHLELRATTGLQKGGGMRSRTRRLARYISATAIGIGTLLVTVAANWPDG